MEVLTWHLGEWRLGDTGTVLEGKQNAGVFFFSCELEFN
jgi:hypothetical protein